MSRNGQPCEVPDPELRGVVVATFPMTAGTHFSWHSHEAHQLAWAPFGVLRVRTQTATWVLPPTRALWVPAGLPHDVMAAGSATMMAVYLDAEACGVRWVDPTPVRAGSLLGELIGYLAHDDLDAARRTRAEAILVDLLEPVAISTIEYRMPVDARAREVAEAIRANPADPRSLAAWGNVVGASGRTLARMFLTDTGVTFGRWRTLARLQCALDRLATGEAVGTVARAVGYETPSAFVAAFRRQTGQTPGAFFTPGDP